MRAIWRNGLAVGATAALLMTATSLAANWGAAPEDAAQKAYRAAVHAAESYVQGALDRPALARTHVAPHFDGQIPSRLTDGDKLRVACHLVEEGDRRYHRYLELVQLRVRMQAQSRLLPERMSEELEALRHPPMQPRHLVRSQALLDACERREQTPLLATRADRVSAGPAS